MMVMLLGCNMRVLLSGPDEEVRGVLHELDGLGAAVYVGTTVQNAAMHFYPTHRIKEIVDAGRVSR